MYRIFQLLGQLDYPDLVRRGVIPDTDPAHEVKSCRFRPWVYSAQKLGAEQIFSHLGMFYDYMARKMIASFFPVPWGADPLEEKLALESQSEVLCRLRDPSVPWKSLVVDVFELCNLYFEGSGPRLRLHKGAAAPRLDGSDQDGNAVISCPSESLYPALGALNKFLQESFSPCRGSGLAFNQEVVTPCGRVCGHPDLLADSWILDIKTVQNFKNSAPRCMLQAFAYAALARAQGRRVDHTGILLTLQQKALFVDIEDWDSGPFLDVLLLESRRLERASDPGREAALAGQVLLSLRSSGRALQACGGAPVAAPETMGWHREKIKGSFLESVKAHLAWAQALGPSVPPCQLYLQPAKSGAKARADPRDIRAAAELVEAFGLDLFSHAPLLINLSNPVTKIDPEDRTFILELLRKDLRLCRQLKGRGCVVHCGKPKGQSYRRALRKMEETIREVLPEASEETPLLLETPAGDKGEVCTTLEEFSSFFRRFEGDPRLRACIDTAHVWGAGYWPLDYLQQWEEAHGAETIALVHFNDSRRERGSRKDEHALPGHGCIGADHMLLTAMWCEERGIPYVHE